MGRKPDLTDKERQKIVQMLDGGQNAVEIAKKLGRHPRTVRKFIQDPTSTRKSRVEPKFRKVSDRDMRAIKRQARKKKLSTSKQIFEAAGVSNVCKSTRCNILRSMGKTKKPRCTPPLTPLHREKRLAWAREHMKTDFSTVLFTDECRATLDGPDGWSRGWIIDGDTTPNRFRRQQGGGGVMFWGAIINDEFLGPVRVAEGVKINSTFYCDLLEKNFLPWFRKKGAAFKRNMIFMQDNAPSHSSRHTQEWLEKKKQKVMVWPPNSPDLNPIEHFWAILKAKIYEGGRQFSGKEQLWDAILECCKDISPETIRNLTKSVDNRLLLVVKKDGGRFPSNHKLLN